MSMNEHERQMIEDMRSDIRIIKEALMGNDFGQTGLIKRVKDTEKWINSANLKVAKVSGGFAVITAIVIFLLDLIFKR